MQPTEQPTLTHSAFLVTGQPIRVVMIDGQPWFATTDVCRILGRSNPGWAGQLVRTHETRTVDLREVILPAAEGHGRTAGRRSHERGNQLLDVISESGLYTLVMRSRKPAAEPFQQWVTAELLPALRRGGADHDAERRRMAKTLAEAIGQQPVDLAARIDGIQDGDFRVLPDGSVHCLHGRTEACVPQRGEDGALPNGPYFRCSELRRAGPRGGKGPRPCGTIRFADVVRRLATPPREPEPPAAAPAPAPTQARPATAATGTAATGRGSAPAPGMLTLSIGKARVHGTAQEIASLLRELGIAVA